ncbi:protein-L-isoaspartate(D-aspartate) O-methyltransferase [Labilibacter sediminis]|nr:protein-L-isoaspartate(D-aspartate) O-methyltransferase [Labilibacter sediminis]
MKYTFIIQLLWIILVYGHVQSQPVDKFEKARKSMVQDQINPRDITDKATLAAMGKVPRHLFVPSGYVSIAYKDGPVPIGYGQTISQPFIVAYMTQAIKPKPNYKVLEIGTGSGYQAAILAEIVDSVFSVEIIPELGDKAKKLLNKLDYDNVHIKIDDGYFGWKEHAPFDAIIVTAAATYIPPPLIEQLKTGGYMIIPVGHPFQVQKLVMVQKKEKKISTRTMLPVRFVPFTRSK